MTVSATVRKAGPYACDGSTVQFPFAFKVFQNSDVEVVRADSNGAETVLKLSADYSVSLNADQSTSPGGTVTLSVAPATGYSITLTSDVSDDQQVQVTNGGAFYPDVINKALDKLTILVQQLSVGVNRSVKVGLSSAASPDTLLNSIYTAQSDAQTSATEAVASAASALSRLNDFKGRYYGPLASDPTTDPLGNAIGAGDLYWNTASQMIRVYSGTAWADAFGVASTLQPFADYSTLRAHTRVSGQTAVYIYGTGIAGMFYADTVDTTSSDNGGTVIVASDGTRWKRLYSGAINIGWFGTDETAIQAAFDAGGSGAAFVFNPALTYTINSTVTIADPQEVSVYAVGAHFELTGDTLMFDLNGRADPTYTDNESRQNFRWIGGIFNCSVANPSKATAFRAFGFRNFKLEPESFGLEIGGFVNDIMLGGKDTYYIGSFKTYRSSNASIFIPPWSSVGGPLDFNVEKTYFAGINGSRFIDAWMTVTDFSLRDYSCNLGTNASTDGVISMRRTVVAALQSVSGSFSVGETVTGGTSGATATVAFTYTHPFPFTIAQPMQYVCLGNRSGSFQDGEQITGGTSGATANLVQLAQNSVWQDVSLEGFAHWEAGSGANGATAIAIENIENKGNVPLNFHIEGGALGINGGGSTGIRLSNIERVTIAGRFAQGTGNTPIALDGCDFVYISPKTWFSTGAISYNNMARDAIDLSAFNVRYSKPQGVSNWLPNTPGSVATNSGAYIDMSSSFNDYAKVGGLPPKRFGLLVKAMDTGSPSSSNCRFRLHHPDTVNSYEFASLMLGGLAAKPASAEFKVGCDPAGKIEYDATQAASLSVWLMVTDMEY